MEAGGEGDEELGVQMCTLPENFPDKIYIALVFSKKETISSPHVAQKTLLCSETTLCRIGSQVFIFYSSQKLFINEMQRNHAVTS
jgi:hypothetical protein